jgi:putative sterol carrier protein
MSVLRQRASCCYKAKQKILGVCNGCSAGQLTAEAVTTSGESRMVNTEMKERLNTRIQDGEFDVEDIPAFLTLFCQFGNELEDLQDEVADWNRSISLVMEGLGTHWLKVEDGRFATDVGTIEEADVVLTMPAEEAAQVFSGSKSAQAAFMSGVLKVEGELPDAIRVQSLIELVLEEIEY